MSDAHPVRMTTTSVLGLLLLACGLALGGQACDDGGKESSDGGSSSQDASDGSDGSVGSDASMDGSMSSDASVDGSDGMDGSIGQDAGMDGSIGQDAGLDAAVGCTVGDDPAGDTGTYTFSGNVLQMPTVSTYTSGFDIDGRTTLSSTSAEGCFALDYAVAQGAPRNIDNRFAYVDSQSNYLFTTTFQESIGGTSPTFALAVRLSHWNQTLDDNCVTATLVLDGTDVASVATVLSSGLTPDLSGFGSITTNLHFIAQSNCSTDPVAACGNIANNCAAQTGADTTATIHGVRLRLHVEPSSGGGFQLVTDRPLSGATVANPTMLGGFLFWGDRNTSNPPTASSFRESIDQVACALGLGSSLASYDNIVGSACDLDSDVSGSAPTACTGTNASNSSADSISFGAFFGSGY